MIQNRTFSFNEECAEILLGCPAGVRQEVYDAIIRSFTSGKRTGMKPMARIIYTFIKADLERMALLFFGWIHPDYRSIVVGLLGCRELVRLEVCDAITRYIISGKQPSLKDEARIAFKPIKREIDRTKSELISAENEVGMGILSLIENKEFKSGGGHFGRDFDKEKKEKENTPPTPPIKKKKIKKRKKKVPKKNPPIAS